MNKAFEAFYTRCGGGWKVVVTIGGRTITACAATQELALEAALRLNSREAARRNQDRRDALVNQEHQWDREAIENFERDRP